MRYQFDDCILDLEAMTLLVRGEPVAIQPQVFDVLRVLIEDRDRVVTKEELLDRVWGHNFVTESALTSRIKSIRQALGDDGRQQRLVRTVHGRGYQFIAPVTEDDGGERGRPTRRLPAFASELIGRHRDLGALDELVDRSRLVTVMGPGGVGKTRLAVACAAARDQDAAFADLTTVRDPSLVLSHLASELGLHVAAGDPMDALVEYAAGRDLLLVVDNVEHVIDAAPELGDLVRRVDDLTVLATSRERLRVEGEQVFPLDPLPTARDDADPAEDPAAFELFVRTARAAAPAIDVERYRPHIEQICTAVDGLPLAIELAAAQTRALPPDLVAARLGHRLTSSSGTRRDAPERQRTMAATIEWSLRWLDADEMLLFARLGAFVGDATLTMIETVCRDELLPDPVEVVTRLVDKSLVRARSDDVGTARFGMLELLRARAAELLASRDDADDIAARHARLIADLVDDVDDRRRGDLVADWTDVLTQLLPEMRRAHDWATAHGEWEVCGRLSASYGAFWHREGGLADGRRMLETTLDHESELSQRTRARLLAALGVLSWDAGDRSDALATWQRAVEHLECLDEPATLAYVLSGIALTTVSEPELHGWGAELIERAVTLTRESGQPAALVEALNHRGEFARGLGDDAVARESYTETIRLATEIGDVAMEKIGLANLAYVECHEGNFEEARRIGRIALRACRAMNRRLMASWSVGELAIPACGLGEHELAARLIGASRRAIAALGGVRYPPDVREDDLVTATLVERMGREEFERHVASGATLGLDEAIALALGERPID